MPARKYIENLTDKRFDRLVVLSHYRKDGYDTCDVICDCGTYKTVLAQHLLRGDTRSCGCLSREVHSTHGLYETGIHQSWRGMKERCFDTTSKDFAHYGGRGITICQGYLNLSNFHADLGDRPKGLTIERPGNDGHYSCGHCEECLEKGWPLNCKWATRLEQTHNRRKFKRRSKEQIAAGFTFESQ